MVYYSDQRQSISECSQDITSHLEQSKIWIFHVTCYSFRHASFYMIALFRDFVVTTSCFLFSESQHSYRTVSKIYLQEAADQSDQIWSIIEKCQGSHFSCLVYNLHSLRECYFSDRKLFFPSNYTTIRSTVLFPSINAILK